MCSSYAVNWGIEEEEEEIATKKTIMDLNETEPVSSRIMKKKDIRDNSFAIFVSDSQSDSDSPRQHPPAPCIHPTQPPSLTDIHHFSPSPIVSHPQNKSTVSVSKGMSLDQSIQNKARTKKMKDKSLPDCTSVIAIVGNQVLFFLLPINKFTLVIFAHEKKREEDKV